MNNNKNKIGVPSKPNERKEGNFVQTEKAAHEAWARFTMNSPKPSALLHFLVARLDRGTNAVVASHKTLASIMGVSVKSIKNYLAVLEGERWIQVVSLGPGTSNAYVVNSYVAWSKGRDKLRYASFSAQVIADYEDQNERTLNPPSDLRSIPTIYEGEWQLPHGEGEEPPSQPSFDGLEADLPYIRGEKIHDDFELIQEEDGE